MDPERPKIQSSQIRTKLMPLHRARHSNYGSICFSKNGLHMAKLSRSEVQVKLAKSQSQSQ
jgi:hypothetical protein